MDVPDGPESDSRPDSEAQRQPVRPVEDPTAVANLPGSTWQPATQLHYHQIPMAPLPQPTPRNHPLAVIGVLGMIIALVLGIGLVGNLTTEVTGVASAAPETPGTSSAGPGTGAQQPRRSGKLEDNPLLKPGAPLAASTCSLPAFGRQPSQLQAYMAAEIACLDASWRPVLKAVNLPFETTELTLSAELGGCKSSGESERPTAFYCGVDNKLHMPVDTVLEDTGGIPSVVIGVLAHEYGHHVQELSGILSAEGRREEKAGHDTPAGQELSRRLELQANCFAGMFLASVAGRGSITKAAASNGAASFAEGGAEQSHGTPAHQGKWAEIGYQNNNTASCNTWVAPAGDVS